MASVNILLLTPLQHVRRSYTHIDFLTKMVMPELLQTLWKTYHTSNMENISHIQQKNKAEQTADGELSSPAHTHETGSVNIYK